MSPELQITRPTVYLGASSLLSRRRHAEDVGYPQLQETGERGDRPHQLLLYVMTISNMDFIASTTGNDI